VVSRLVHEDSQCILRSSDPVRSSIFWSHNQGLRGVDLRFDQVKQILTARVLLAEIKQDS
jgi:hypothetical protein